jgi:hypothetical protein
MEQADSNLSAIHIQTRQIVKPLTIALIDSDTRARTFQYLAIGGKRFCR